MDVLTAQRIANSGTRINNIVLAKEIYLKLDRMPEDRQRFLANHLDLLTTGEVLSGGQTIEQMTAQEAQEQQAREAAAQRLGYLE